MRQDQFAGMSTGGVREGGSARETAVVSGRRVLAISDLHSDYKNNAAWLASLDKVRFNDIAGVFHSRCDCVHAH